MSASHRPSPERRISARLVDSFEFSIGFDGYDVTASVINISATGLLCRTTRELPVMSKIDMALMLPSRAVPGKSDTIKIQGVVVRNEQDERGTRAAIFFLDMSAPHRKKLEVYLNRLTEAG
jgi:c-di-GMP-binding flagellar brake protein YcgR